MPELLPGCEIKDSVTSCVPAGRDWIASALNAAFPTSDLHLPASSVVASNTAPALPVRHHHTRAPGLARMVALARLYSRGHGEHRSLNTALVEAANAAAKTKSTYLRDKFYRLKARRGYKRAAVAVAHKILVAIYHMFFHPVCYNELGDLYLDKLYKHSLTRNLVHPPGTFRLHSRIRAKMLHKARCQLNPIFRAGVSRLIPKPGSASSCQSRRNNSNDHSNRSIRYDARPPY